VEKQVIDISSGEITKADKSVDEQEAALLALEQQGEKSDASAGFSFGSFTFGDAGEGFGFGNPQPSGLFDDPQPFGEPRSSTIVGAVEGKMDETPATGKLAGRFKIEPQSNDSFNKNSSESLQGFSRYTFSSKRSFVAKGNVPEVFQQNTVQSNDLGGYQPDLKAAANAILAEDNEGEGNDGKVADGKAGLEAMIEKMTKGQIEVLTYKKGDQVVAQYMKEVGVFDGSVEKVNEDGTYIIKYSDGDSWNACPGQRMRPRLHPVLDETKGLDTKKFSIEDVKAVQYLVKEQGLADNEAIEEGKLNAGTVTGFERLIQGQLKTGVKLKASSDNELDSASIENLQKMLHQAGLSKGAIDLPGDKETSLEDEKGVLGPLTLHLFRKWTNGQTFTHSSNAARSFFKKLPAFKEGERTMITKSTGQIRKDLELAKQAEVKLQNAREQMEERKKNAKNLWIQMWNSLGSEQHREKLLQIFAGPTNQILSKPVLDVKILLKELMMTAKTSVHPQVSLFLDELNERIDVQSLPTVTRAKLAPELWRYRDAFSLGHFASQLNKLEAEDRKKHAKRGIVGEPPLPFPVLSEFLRSEGQLKVLRYLHCVLRFQSILIPRLTRTLDMRSARKMGAMQAIEEYTKGASEKRACLEAFAGYKKAWELAWNDVRTFLPAPGEETGEPIPARFRVQINGSTPITMLLASDRDEGKCASALTAELVRRHNAFLVTITTHLKNNGQALLQDTSTYVSPRFFSEAQAISYDLDSKFVPFVAKQCVDHTEEGGTVYNFDNAQQYLMDTFFVGKPLVDAFDSQALKLQFADDDDAVDIAALARRVPQDELTRDMRDSILSDLRSGAAALKCLRQLETAISFLSATGTVRKTQNTSDLGDMLLSTYMRGTLLMGDAVESMGSKTIEQQVCLKHVASLWSTLRSLLVKSKFQDVHIIYKHHLESKITRKIKEDVTGGPLTTDRRLETLLQLMQTTIATVLVESSMDASKPAKDFIGLAELDGKFLRTYEWFQQGFPGDVPLSCVVDLYKTLEDVHNTLNISISTEGET